MYWALIYLLPPFSLLSHSVCCQQQLSHTSSMKLELSPAPGSPVPYAARQLECCFPAWAGHSPWRAKPALAAAALWGAASDSGRDTRDRCHPEKYQRQLPASLRQAVANLCCALTSSLFPLHSTPQVNLMRTLSSDTSVPEKLQNKQRCC